MVPKTASITFSKFMTMPDSSGPDQTRHYYHACGLTIRSDIALDKLNAAEPGASDLHITLGTTPDRLDNPTLTMGNWMTAADQLLLTVPGIVRLLVTDGNRIVATPQPGASERDLQAFILSSGFGAILQQRGLHTQHASGIEVNGGAVLFTGKSGMGKSTIAGEMIHRGHRMVTDDIAAITIAPDGTPTVRPAWPGLRLWPDSARAAHFPATAAMAVRPDLEKAIFPAPDFCKSPLPVTHMFVLTRHADPVVKVTPLVAGDRVAAFAKNTFRKKFMRGMGHAATQFKSTVALARQVNVAEIARPDPGPGGDFDITTLADAMEIYLGTGEPVSLPVAPCR